jgi:hypothetical protein
MENTQLSNSQFVNDQVELTRNPILNFLNRTVQRRNECMKASPISASVSRDSTRDSVVTSP